MCKEMLDVVFEVLDDTGVGIELRCLGWGRKTAAFYVKACEAEEVEFASMIVILGISVFQPEKLHMGMYVVICQRRNDPQPMLPSLEYSPINTLKCLLIIHPQSWHKAQGVSNTDAQCLTSDQLRAHRY